DAAHPRALADERAEPAHVLRDVDLARPRRGELHHRIAEGDVRVLGEIDLADARVADERAVARPEIAHPHAALGRDDLHVHGAHLAVVEHEVAGFVAADHDRVRADVELLLRARTLGDRQFPAADLDPGPRGDGRIHDITCITSHTVAGRVAAASAG